MNKYREYWSKQLAAVLPVLELTVDALPERDITPQILSVTSATDSTLLKKFQHLLHEQKGTVQEGTFSLVNLLLYHYSRQDDLIIGFLLKEILPVRTQLDKTAPFSTLLKKVKENLTQASDNQEYGIEAILNDLYPETSPKKNELFKVIFSCTDEPLAISLEQSPCELLFAFNTTADTLTISFYSDRFKPDTIQRMATHLEGLMSAIVEEPNTAIGDLYFINEDEKRQLMFDFNDTKASFPEEETLNSLFEQQVRERPEAVALIFQEKEFTFSELHQQSNQFGRYLREKYAIQNDDLIGISLGRNEWMIITILAVLKSGGAYVPIDPDYPQERIDYIVTDSKCKVLIDEEELATFQRTKNLYSSADLQLINRPTDLVYVIYTSGSTGKPKGCMIEHRSVINRLCWMWSQYGFDHEEVMLQKTTFTFDVSIPEIFTPLCLGAQMILCDKDDIGSPERILSLIERHAATSVHFVPVMLNAFMDQLEREAAPENKLAFLKRVFSSGEALSLESTRRWYTLLNIPLINLYGPTEATVEVSYFDTHHSNLQIPIGKPIWNTSLYILSSNLDLVPMGLTGEICIAGLGLSRGYLHKPELTAERFVPHPFVPESKIYRTGDLGRWLPDGQIAYIGRIDEQVKIRGYRIELGEIESALATAPGIQSAVVIARNNAFGEKRLLAYIIPRAGDYQPAHLRTFLEQKLPAYMIPSSFIELEKFPQTPSGKIDKKALPSPERKRPQLDVLYKAPKSAIEKKISALWATMLELDSIGVNDNFFEMGGNSLLALKIVAELRSRHDIILPVTKLYQYPTITAVVTFLGYGQDTKPVRKKKNRESTNQAVAIIGMAGKFPGADTIDELWEVLCEGRETTSFFRDEEIDVAIEDEVKNDPAYVKARGIIRDAEMFDPEFFGINPKLAQLMDPQQRVLMEISRDVLEKSGYLPANYDGVIGVFAGSGYNSYYLNNVQQHPKLMSNIGNFQVGTVNEKDYISSRTAYHLDLKGPAVSVFSACSTSLLAIAQAVESIRTQQCDIAIAGAASITAPINSGHLYQEGAMLSKDGHCRSFDEMATGTVFSDGAGVVLLKSLEAAKADGDTIFAVIRGIGVNNDGKSKGSFTAPSSGGQAAAISMAIEDAQIDPATISYVEAHGTGTPLGDPIEIEGLKQAFGEQAKHGYCAIGSIKSNMGHLTAAAGVAGLIKTTLALYYKQLPPSINFNQANPNIPFAQSPFYVNTLLKDWESDTTRNAGVSSFGVGGTNVHVVLEEFGHELPENTDSGRQKQLFCWSAHTPESLDTYAQSFLKHLQSGKKINLSDAAYTLQTTRQDFAYRRFLVAGTTEELEQQLTSPTAKPTASALKSLPGETIFLFPGQGAQYLNMALELYEQEPIFKTHVDECSEILLNFMDRDIRSVIYPNPDAPSSLTALNDTQYTQPALFVMEYALAKLWMSWGIQPSILCGHSIGEYVAAHLAGVFSLEDGLKLVALRGKMVSSLPSGSMLSVRTSAAAVAELLPPQLSIAAVNSPKLCVVAGADEEINAFITVLDSKQILSRKLNTSHAFHSHMMDPIVPDFGAIVQQIKLSKPIKPIVSTVTGLFLTDTEAQSASYWTEHLRKTVQFSKAIETIMTLENPLCIEAGPGNSCTTLIWQHGRKSEITAVSSLQQKAADPEKEEAGNEYNTLLTAVGQVWSAGITPDWQAFYGEQHRRKIDIPGYTYQKKKCWVEPNNLPIADNLPPYLEIKNTIMRRDTLVQKIKNILEDASGIEMMGITPDLSFIEIGLDSLLLTQVAITLKKEFALPITFRQLNDEYGTIDALADYLDASLAPESHTPPIVNYPPVKTQVQQTAYAAPADTALGLIAQQLQLLSKQVELLTGHQQVELPKADSAPVYVQDQVPSPVQEKQADLSAQELAEIKKPFGAIARIEKQKTDLAPEQQQFLQELIATYNHKTAKSKAYTQENRPHMADPRVVSGFKPATKEIVYAIVMNKSKGSRLWDIDGNEYIDALNGFGSSMLGYQPDFIKEALHAQIEKGYEIGPQHELSGEVSKLVCEFTGFDRTGLCNTGSEAVLGAMRIARTVTGRSLIVAFSGSYHGIIDEVIVRGTKKLKTFPAAPGIMPEAVGNMLILDYGTEETLQLIRERANDIAAVLVEPVQSRRPEFFPLEFLQELRTITESSGAALIFDEVISGFRFHPGGIQGMYNLKADIATYGKVAGGGISIGIIAGKRSFMDALDGGYWQFGDASVPEIGVTYFAGTFVRHPLALATTKASLDYMKAEGPALQQKLNAQGKVLAEKLNAVCLKLRVPIEVVQFASLWRLKFSIEYPYAELLFTLMRGKGIHILEGFPCFLTTAHSDEDVAKIVHVFEESLTALKEVKLIPQTAKEEVNFNSPPIPGAKLGKDKDGNPSWFIADNDNPGKYLQIN